MASDFNKFARELDSYAISCRDALSKARTASESAEQKWKESRRNGGADPVAAAKAEGSFRVAKAEYEAMKRNVSGEIDSKVADIRNRLAVALDDFFSADPSKLDVGTLELLKSGILTAAEYKRLMDKAIQADNPTMMRMVAKYARQAADVEYKKDSKSTDAVFLKAVAEQDRFANGDSYFETFDELANVLRRGVNRYPESTLDMWESVTGETVDHF